MTDEEIERDTQPPTPDPVMACVERIEAKVDAIVAALARLTDKVVELSDENRQRKEETEFLEQRVRSYTPAAGMPAQRNGNGNDGHG